jgi:Predicted pseudouridylate synthase
MVERVKEHPASKTYRMDVRFAEPVSAQAFEAALAALDGATIEQNTPQRVSHRRAAKTRVRAVYDASGELETGDEHGSETVDADSGQTTGATVEIHGEGGLYVKELISSDEGRTEPSLAGELGVDATVAALDVLAVEGEEEPFADPEFLRMET